MNRGDWGVEGDEGVGGVGGDSGDSAVADDDDFDTDYGGDYYLLAGDSCCSVHVEWCCSKRRRR